MVVGGQVTAALILIPRSPRIGRSRVCGPWCASLPALSTRNTSIWRLLCAFVSPSSWATSRAASSTCRSTRSEGSIDEALQRIASLCGFKRAVLYELTDDRKRYSITHRYLAPGIEPTEPMGVEQPIEHFGYVAARLSLKQPIVLATQGSPEEAASERRDLTEGGMSHAGGVSPRGGHRSTRCGDLRRTAAADPTAVEMLGVVGELFTSALHRERVERGLVDCLRFEEALSRIGARLIDSSQESFEAVVDDALRTVGQALDFERVLVFRLSPDRCFLDLTRGVVRLWCSASFRASLTGLPIDELDGR